MSSRKPEGELARLLERIGLLQATLPKPSAPPPAEEPTPKADPTLPHAGLLRRLRALKAELATSFEQVLWDLEGPERLTYIGPAGEAREVLRATEHLLAPDASVKAEPWFVGEKGRPTQAERVRFAVQRNGSKVRQEVIDSDGLVDAKIGALARSVYETASGALHAGTQRREARKIVNHVVVVLDEILPD